MADAKIFLSDCLACDSCVTAEEGLQVSQQNAKDFFRVLNLNKVGLLGHLLVLRPRGPVQVSRESLCWGQGIGLGPGPVSLA